MLPGLYMWRTEALKAVVEAINGDLQSDACVMNASYQLHEHRQRLQGRQVTSFGSVTVMIRHVR